MQSSSIMRGQGKAERQLLLATDLRMWRPCSVKMRGPSLLFSDDILQLSLHNVSLWTSMRIYSLIGVTGVWCTLESRPPIDKSCDDGDSFQVAWWRSLGPMRMTARSGKLLGDFTVLSLPVCVQMITTVLGPIEASRTWSSQPDRYKRSVDSSIAISTWYLLT